MLKSTLKYAAYAAVCCICLRMVDNQVRKCLEPPDDWEISDESHGTEEGAGYLKKKGKNSDTWSKRWVVLDKNKLVYYTDQLRGKVQGEIVMVGAYAQNSSLFADTETRFYFVITHSVCGDREFYAKTDNRRRQWVNKINNMSDTLGVDGHYGTLKKLGGLAKFSWQERWCVCTGPSGETMDYFDDPKDNQSKGFLRIKGATIVESEHADQKYCFTIQESSGPTASVENSTSARGFFGFGSRGIKKGKVYTFAVDTEGDQNQWISVLKTAASQSNFMDNLTMNPMLEGDEGGDSRLSFGPNAPVESVKEGYLNKKSTNSMSLNSHQRRWFVINPEKQTLAYYAQKGDEKKKGVEPKGTISMNTIVPQKDVIIDKSDKCVFRFSVKSGREYELVAAKKDLAQEWVDIIKIWVDFYNKEVIVGTIRNPKTKE